MWVVIPTIRLLLCLYALSLSPSRSSNWSFASGHCSHFLRWFRLRKIVKLFQRIFCGIVANVRVSDIFRLSYLLFNFMLFILCCFQCIAGILIVKHVLDGGINITFENGWTEAKNIQYMLAIGNDTGDRFVRILQWWLISELFHFNCQAFLGLHESIFLHLCAYRYSSFQVELSINCDLMQWVRLHLSCIDPFFAITYKHCCWYCLYLPFMCRERAA